MTDDQEPTEAGAITDDQEPEKAAQTETADTSDQGRSRWEIHLLTAGLFVLLALVVGFFWAYPRILAYALLIIVATVSYGALYLIAAAYLDPQKSRGDRGSMPRRLTEAIRRGAAEESTVVASNAKPAPKKKPAAKPKRKTTRAKEKSPTTKSDGGQTGPKTAKTSPRKSSQAPARKTSKTRSKSAPKSKTP